MNNSKRVEEVARNRPDFGQFCSQSEVSREKVLFLYCFLLVLFGICFLWILLVESYYYCCRICWGLFCLVLPCGYSGLILWLCSGFDLCSFSS